MQATPSKQIDLNFTMKNGSIFTVPNTWIIKNCENYAQITSPENDCNIYFFEVPFTDNIDTIVVNTWKNIQPNFNLSCLNQIEPPSKSPWEKTYQITFDVPTSESRIVMTLIRIYKQHAYLCLIDGKIAGFSRRAAEVNRMIESWRPAGYLEPQLSVPKLKRWTHADNQTFNKFIIDVMQKLNIPGAAVAMVHRNGTILYQEGFGIKRFGSNDAVTTQTPFMIGSTTKPLTTLLMAMLIDKKKLSWDTPIIDLLKNFRLADDDLTKKLQLYQTISASTGMPRRDLDWVFKYTGIKPEDRIAQMKDMHPTTGLGETFQYSNYLFMAGGYAAAQAYLPQKNLEAAYALAIQELIFDPLGMKNTVLKIEDALKLGAAFPHTISYKGQLCESSFAIEKCCYSIAPAGAVWSTVEDLAHYLVLELNNGLFENKRLVNEKTILERRLPQIKIGEKSAYGLGLFLSHEQGLDIVGHGGNTFGFSSDLFFIPEHEIGIVILTNAFSANSFLAAVKQKFIELTFTVNSRAEEMVDFAIQERAASVKKNLKSISVTAQAMKWIGTLSGKYYSDHLGQAALVKTNYGTGYEMQFEEWKTQVGCEIDNNGKKFLVLLDGPVPGIVKLLVANQDSELILEMGQECCTFKRIETISQVGPQAGYATIA